MMKRAHQDHAERQSQSPTLTLPLPLLSADNTSSILQSAAGMTRPRPRPIPRHHGSFLTTSSREQLPVVPAFVPVRRVSSMTESGLFMCIRDNGDSDLDLDHEEDRDETQAGLAAAPAPVKRSTTRSPGLAADLFFPTDLSFPLELILPALNYGENDDSSEPGTISRNTSHKKRKTDLMMEELFSCCSRTLSRGSDSSSSGCSSVSLFARPLALFDDYAFTKMHTQEEFSKSSSSKLESPILERAISSCSSSPKKPHHFDPDEELWQSTVHFVAPPSPIGLLLSTTDFGTGGVKSDTDKR